MYEHLLRGRICVSCKASLEAQKATRTQIGMRHFELKGKNLACWCALDKPCHADVLLRLVN